MKRPIFAYLFLMSCLYLSDDNTLVWNPGNEAPSKTFIYDSLKRLDKDRVEVYDNGQMIANIDYYCIEL